jgi:uncharacterized membrane protein YadS
MSSEEQQPVIPQPLPASPPWYNTEDYWTVWVGFAWFVAAAVCGVVDLDVAGIHPWHNATDLAASFTALNTAGLALIYFATLATMYVVHKAMERDDALWQYAVVLTLVVGCKIIGAFHVLDSIGLGAAVWCIVAGIIFRNLLGDAFAVFKPIYSLEFFIKISIVLLALNFKEIAIDGAKGLVVAWVETILLLATVYCMGIWIFQMPKEHAVVTSVGLSVCGGSAAIAIRDCVGADDTMVRAFITIMTVLTIPAIPSLPAIANKAGWNDAVTGAWIGGSVDSTGAVLACASLGSEATLKNAIVVKMLQNILIGPIALGVTAAWNGTVRPMLLWDKFPKFVMGFIVVCAVTTLLPGALEERVATNSFALSEWFSSISFVIIGMDINIRELAAKASEYKMIVALYICGQLLDFATTLGASYVMFQVV